LARQSSSPVVVFNCIYAFTKVQAQCVVEFLEIMSIKDLQEIGSGDDIFFAFLEDQAPLCHDVGLLEFCPSYARSGIA
jgi:hypothetical protein